MKFYKKLYWGSGITNHKVQRKICWNLKHNAGQVQIYVLALTQDREQMEFYHCAYLQQNYYKKHPPLIIGIAKSYDEIVALLQQILEEAIKETGNAEIKQYLIRQL